MDNLGKLQIACAVGLLFAFLLPWISISGRDWYGIDSSLSGYQVPYSKLKLGYYDDGMPYAKVISRSNGERNSSSILLYLLYFIPFFTFLSIVQNLRGKDTTLVNLVTSLLPIVSLIIILANFMDYSGKGLREIIGLGGSLTLLAGVTMIISIIMKSKPAERT